MDAVLLDIRLWVARINRDVTQVTYGITAVMDSLGKAQRVTINGRRLTVTFLLLVIRNTGLLRVRRHNHCPSRATGGQMVGIAAHDRGGFSRLPAFGGAHRQKNNSARAGIFPSWLVVGVNGRHVVSSSVPASRRNRGAGLWGVAGQLALYRRRERYRERQQGGKAMMAKLFVSCGSSFWCGDVPVS